MINQASEYELREALRKDFNSLYVARFTTNWVVERKLRSLELDIMRLDNLMALINSEVERREREARLNEIQNAYEYWINGRKFISSYFRDRIAELSSSKESVDNE